MFAYGSDSGVSIFNKNRTYTSSSTVTTTDLANYRLWIEEDIDARLTQAGYTTPIPSGSSPKAFNICSFASNLGVAALAEKAVFAGNVAPGESTHYSQLWDMYEKKLTEYCGGWTNNGVFIRPRLRLPDADSTNSVHDNANATPKALELIVSRSDIAPRFTSDRIF